jgi:TatD DNase family protein
VIDFHCHLDLYPNPEEIAQECVSRGVYVLSVTTTPSAWTGTKALTEGCSRVRTALGLHPQLAHERRSEIDLFAKLLSDTRYVGEVGLDGAPEFKQHWEDQVFVFSRVLLMSKEAGGRILSIHSRRAASAVLDELEPYVGHVTPILHWFSGNLRELKRASDLGCWFSVGPAMLKSEKGRLLAGKMPPDRMLTESDGPFGQIEGRALLPWDAQHSIFALTELWQVTHKSAEQRIVENFKRLTATI